MTTSSPRPPAFFKLLHGFESWMQSISLIPDQAYIDPTHFAWTKQLEICAAEIYAEYDLLRKSGEPIPPFQEVSKEQGAITNDSEWKTFLLYAYGAKSLRNTAICPNTTRAIEAIPEMRTAFFSILAPGKIIPPHRGPYKGLVRCHLALKIPDGDCGLRVRGEESKWISGKCLFFDDTLTHEAWNKTNDERVVLFLDVLRPLKKPFGKWNDRLIYWIASSGYGRRSIQTFRDWYARHGITNDATIPRRNKP
jgi:aspartyl/asparaginyl beta-hydroxylase (cupin superfamily)